MKINGVGISTYHKTCISYECIKEIGQSEVSTAIKVAKNNMSARLTVCLASVAASTSFPARDSVT